MNTPLPTLTIVGTPEHVASPSAGDDEELRTRRARYPLLRRLARRHAA